MDTRVVMGQETLLKTSEIQKGKTKEPSNSQAIPLPGIPGAAAPLSSTMTDTKMETTQKERQSLSPKRGEDERKQQPPNSFPSPLLKTLLPMPSSSTESITASDILTDNPGEGCTPSQNEVPSTSFPELAYPVVLSFSEPAYIVDPLRVGVPTFLDPDPYYTAPSTPIKATPRHSHMKHHSYPGSPVLPLSPGSPSDSEELCSPLTSPSGSYVTAEGGSWTSSYTSSTSPSPNLLFPEEASEAPACFVRSLSEIGDEVGEERSRGRAEREQEHERGEAFLYTSEIFGRSSRLSDAVIPEEEDVVRGEEVQMSSGCSHPVVSHNHWMVEDISPRRSSSGRSSDSQEDVVGSEGSLCLLEDAHVRQAEYPATIPQEGLELQLEACGSEEHYSYMDQLAMERVRQLERASDALGTDTDTPTPSSASLSHNSPLLEAFGDIDSNSFMLFPGAYSDDGPDEDRMIPASLLSFPLQTSLIFQADSMEITLFPTEEETEVEEVNKGNEKTDVDAYAAGEDEADVEDVDDDDDDYEEDKEEAADQAKVEKKVAEEENDVDVDEECDGKAVEDPTAEEDTSASFLHSLSETSINEGLDELFCYPDDTDDSLDSASYNGEEDERLYSTERHAQPPEPRCLDASSSNELHPEAEQHSDSVQAELSPLIGHDEQTHLTEPPHSSEPAPYQPPSSRSPSGSESDMEISSGLSDSPSHPKDICDSTPVVNPPVVSALCHDAASNSANVCFHATSCPSVAIQNKTAEQTYQILALEFRPEAAAPEIKEQSLLEHIKKDRDQQSGISEKEPTDEREGDSFKLLIKPRHSQFRSKQQSAGIAQPLLAKSETQKTPTSSGAVIAISVPIVQTEHGDLELDQQNGNSLAEGVSLKCESLEGSNTSVNAGLPTVATNDLNKGVPLLSYPKDPIPNPSNIPISACSEIVSDPTDNLILNPDLCPCDSAQENLRENTLSAEEGGTGVHCSPHTPLAISPKRENSETISVRGMDSAAAWGADGMGLRLGLGLGPGVTLGAFGVVESLSLSLGKSYELEEAESLLMCNIEGQSTQMAMAPDIPDIDSGENENDAEGDKENNSALWKREGMADMELIGEGVPQYNLSHWRSMEEISEAGGGEDGSSRFPDDNVNNLNPGDGGHNKDALDQVLEMPVSGTLNALSEELRPLNASVSVTESTSNIPLHDVPAPDEIHKDRKPTDSSLNLSDTEDISESPCNISTLGSDMSTAGQLPSSPELINSRCQNNTPLASKEIDIALSLIGGSFGSFTSKPKLNKPARGCQETPSAGLGKGEEEDIIPQLEPETMELQTEGQREVAVSHVTDRDVSQPKTNGAFKGGETGVCNSGERDDEDMEKAKNGDGEQKKKDPEVAKEVLEEKEECEKTSKDMEKMDTNKTKNETEKQKRRGKQSVNNKERDNVSPEDLSEDSLCHSHHVEPCADQPVTAKKGRKGRQDKHKAFQPGPEPKDCGVSLAASADGYLTGGPAQASKSKRGRKQNKMSVASDKRQAVPGNDEAGGNLDTTDTSSSSPDACISSHGNGISATHTGDKSQDLASRHLDLMQEQEVLDNRPLPRESPKDMNENNISRSPTRDHTSSPSRLFSSPPPLSSSPRQCSFLHLEDDLTTPVQESHRDLPPLSSPPQPILTNKNNNNKNIHKPTGAPSTPTPPSITGISSASASSITLSPPSLSQPTQESPCGSQHQVSMSFLQSRPNPPPQSEVTALASQLTRPAEPWSGKDTYQGTFQHLCIKLIVEVVSLLLFFIFMISILQTDFIRLYSDAIYHRFSVNKLLLLFP